MFLTDRLAIAAKGGVNATAKVLADEKAVTAVAFWHRAVAFFAAHGITPIRRCLTRRDRFESGPGRTRHARMGRCNGTLAREWAYVRAYTSGHERRVTLGEFVNYYNHDRPHAALGGRPPISRTSGSDYRIICGHPPEPLTDIPQQLTFDDLV